MTLQKFEKEDIENALDSRTGTIITHWFIYSIMASLFYTLYTIIEVALTGRVTNTQYSIIAGLAVGINGLASCIILYKFIDREVKKAKKKLIKVDFKVTVT